MYIKIKAYTGVSWELVIQKDESTFLVSVKEKPKNNNANKRIM